MEQGKEIPELLRGREKLLTELKNLLLEQQKWLVRGDTEQITRLSEMQVNCMEKIQTLELSWQELIEKIRTEQDLQKITVEQIILTVLSDSDNAVALALLDKIKKLVGEIEAVKRNNTLLIQNSLVLVRSTLNFLQRGTATEPVYHPSRKQRAGHILVNKKL